jgi:GAF domain-containing protein
MPHPDAADAEFAAAANQVLADAAELARALTGAHQSAATVIAGGDWSTARKHFSLSEKYAAWADYAAPAVGVGTHAWLLGGPGHAPDAAGRAAAGAPGRAPRVVRFTHAELEAHPAWLNFGTEAGRHPPMRGWMAARIEGRDGTVWGMLQLTDKADGGDFTAADEAAFTRFARLVTAALEALWDVRLLRRGEPTPAAAPAAPAAPAA